jgi:hypothetical protein
VVTDGGICEICHGVNELRLYRNMSYKLEIQDPGELPTRFISICEACANILGKTMIWHPVRMWNAD